MKVLAMILGLLATFAIFLFGAAGIKDFIKKQAEIEVANTVQTPSVTEEKVTKQTTTNQTTTKQVTTKQTTTQKETTTKKKPEAAQKATTKKTVKLDRKKAFQNAVFIGDSRTEGFYLYSGITQYCSNFLVHKGFNVGDFYKTGLFGKNGKQTAYQMLRGKRYEKVFLMQGLNELGWPDVNEFGRRYETIIKDIHKMMPKATIYVQEIIQVSEKKSKESPYFNKKNCDLFNKKVRQICKGKSYVKYVPLNHIFTNKKGYLKADVGTDGIHLSKPYCELWLKELCRFLKEEK